MSDDLIERLRINTPYEAPRCLEAADRIEAQAAEIERLRGKLREIEALPNYRCVAADMRKIARTALSGKAEQ
jgi:hypothetical protein